MNTKLLIPFLILGNVTLIAPVLAQTENPPAETYHPGFWQPVARIDSNRPTEVKLINKTDIVLEYDLTNNKTEEVPKLEPNNSATVKGLKLPAYILINATIGSPDIARIRLEYQVSTDDNNNITVTIVKGGNNSMGNRTVNIHETGAIYVY